MSNAGHLLFRSPMSSSRKTSLRYCARHRVNSVLPLSIPFGTGSLMLAIYETMNKPSFRFIAHALFGSLAKASCRPDGRPYEQSDRLPDIADSIIDLNQISFVFPPKMSRASRRVNHWVQKLRFDAARSNSRPDCQMAPTSLILTSR